MSNEDPLGVPPMIFAGDQTFVGAERYAFIDLRWFLLPDGPCEPECAIAALLKQHKYQEDYWSDHPAGQGLHGDYLATKLNPDLFEATSLQRMAEELRNWAVEGWRRTDTEQREARAALESALAAFGSPSDVLRLRDLDAGFLPAGDVDPGYPGVFAGDWVEYVGLYASGQVCVMVAAIC